MRKFCSLSSPTSLCFSNLPPLCIFNFSPNTRPIFHLHRYSSLIFPIEAIIQFVIGSASVFSPSSTARLHPHGLPLIGSPARMSTSVSQKCHVHKFRLSQKPPELEAARLRENQRRHRQRVKARTEELEAALASTQMKLEDALQRIDILTAEVRQLRRVAEQSNSTPHTPPPFSASPTTDIIAPSNTSHPPDRLIVAAEVIPPVAGQACGCGVGGCSKGSAPSTAPQPQAAGGERDTSVSPALPSTRALNEQRSLVLSEVNSLEDGCALLPPPGPGESTMLCRDAYSIITQRLSDVDFDVVTESLKPGFRRAIAPGSGCRVQTHILFSFVDRIT